MKKTLVVVFVVFLFAVVVVVFVLRRTNQRQPAPLQTTKSAPAPEPSFPPAAQPDKLEYVPQPTYASRPDRVDSYVLLQDDSSSRAAVLASALGVNGPPTMFVGSRGAFTTWSSEDKTLSVGGTPTEVSYASGISPGNVIQKSEKELVSLALSFLQSINILHKDLSLEPMRSLYFAPTGGSPNELGGPAGATVAQINFQYRLGGLPFYMRLPDIPGASVRLNAEGAIVSFSAYWFYSIEKSLGKIVVAAPEAAASRLVGGEGVLLSVASDDDKNSEELPYYQINSSSITTTTLGHYLPAGETKLVPVYVFWGTGRDERSGKSVNTTTIVSGLP